MVGDEDVTSCKGKDYQLTEEGDVIEDVRKEGFESLFSGVHLNQLGRGTAKMEFDTMTSINDLSSQDLVDNVVQYIVTQHINIKSTFISNIGRNILVHY